MDVEAQYQEGQWIEASEGIGQVISVQDFYFEEFNLNLGELDRLGDYDCTLVVYKMLCDFEGKLRKRKRILFCNKNSCRKLGKGSIDLVDRISNEHPDAIKKHREYQEKGPIGMWSMVMRPLDEKFINEIVPKINRVVESLGDSFTYLQLCNKIDSAKVGLNMRELNKLNSPSKAYVRFELFNKNFEVENRQRVFSKANLSIFKKP